MLHHGEKDRNGEGAEYGGQADEAGHVGAVTAHAGRQHVGARRGGHGGEQHQHQSLQRRQCKRPSQRHRRQGQQQVPDAQKPQTHRQFPVQAAPLQTGAHGHQP